MRVQLERTNSMTKLILGSHGAEIALGTIALLLVLEEGKEFLLRQRIVGVRKEHLSGELRREENLVLWNQMH